MRSFIRWSFCFQGGDHFRGGFFGAVEDPGHGQARQDPLDHPGWHPGFQQSPDLQDPVHQPLIVVAVAVWLAPRGDQPLFLVIAQQPPTGAGALG